MDEEKVLIYKPEDCIEEMTQGLLNGKIKGTTTYNADIDKCWTWRTQEANIWTGYANEGKSLFIKQLSIKKALETDKKFVFSSPEDFPAHEFFDDMIHTLTGRTTDKDYPGVISEDLYRHAYELIKDLFIFVYIKPPNNTIKGVLEAFRQVCEDEQGDVYGCIIDPIVKFARPKGFSERDDIYAGYIGSLAIDFCRETNTSFHLVMHQLTPQMEVGTVKQYPEPSMYRVKGGGSWSDGFDNVLSVWRPKYASDKMDTEVQFASQKIKKQKLVGIPQRLAVRFDRKSNRYTDIETGFPLFDFDKFMPSKFARKLTL
ncbi:MAG: hypothetical protein WCP46_00335 [Alphaproteobacteria bacterium]